MYLHEYAMYLIENIKAFPLQAYQRSSLIGCSIEPDPNVYEAKTSVGLVRGHAYSVTKVVKAKIETPRISGEMPLIRVS